MKLSLHFLSSIMPLLQDKCPDSRLYIGENKQSERALLTTVFPRINVHALIFEDALCFRK